MPAIMVKRRDGSLEPVQEDKINLVIQRACQGLDKVSWSDVALGCQVSWYSGISTEEIDESVIMSARSLIEQHPQYSQVAARLLLFVLYQRVFGPGAARAEDVHNLYKNNFRDYLVKGIDAEMLDQRLLEFDMDIITSAI
ncbi:MAG: ribonucleoside-diphosphate reductase subunit alpha, partial [Cyanobacteria bacterium HKST-UBA04]|nr:ribonucleoside-diphosphate reductase subunit alpha [Cyanobacteria bacterium HKST-UBA04]